MAGRYMPVVAAAHRAATDLERVIELLDTSGKPCDCCGILWLASRKEHRAAGQVGNIIRKLKKLQHDLLQPDPSDKMQVDSVTVEGGDDADDEE